MPVGGSKARLRSSVVHHLHAYMFWISYQVIWKNEKEFCTDAGVGVDRWGAWQCGRVLSQPEDEALLLRMFGPARMPTPAQIDAETWRAERIVETLERSEHLERFFRIRRMEAAPADDGEADDRSTTFPPLSLPIDPGLTTPQLLREMGFLRFERLAAER
jgi:hypothetical protein